MYWFKEFIDETVRKWLKYSTRTRSNPQVEAAISNKTGKEGEEFVRDIVNERKAYYAELSLNSMSPADVWAIATTDDITHIALFQVKTTRVNTEPAELLSWEEEQIILFTKFVADEFSNSSLVPDEYKDKHYIVSSGYAGIVIDGWDYSINSAYKIRQETSSEELETIPELNEYTLRFHQFE